MIRIAAMPIQMNFAGDFLINRLFGRESAGPELFANPSFLSRSHHASPSNSSTLPRRTKYPRTYGADGKSSKRPCTIASRCAGAMPVASDSFLSDIPRSFILATKNVWKLISSGGMMLVSYPYDSRSAIFSSYTSRGFAPSPGPMRPWLSIRSSNLAARA